MAAMTSMMTMFLVMHMDGHMNFFDNGNMDNLLDRNMNNLLDRNLFDDFFDDEFFDGYLFNDLFYDGYLLDMMMMNGVNFVWHVNGMMFTKRARRKKVQTKTLG